MPSPSRRLLACTALLIAACGDSPVATDPDARAIDARAIDADSTSDAGVCTSPVVLTVDPGAEVRATAALHALSATATLEWSPIRGTVSRIEGLSIPIDCADDINEPFWAVLAASPDLFQIDRAEWQADATLACASVPVGSSETIRIRRLAFGERPMRTDVFTAVAEHRDDGMVLRLFGGTYIPPATPALIAALDACPDLGDPALVPRLRGPSFAYTIFAEPPAPTCSLEALGTYTATPIDVLTIEPDSELRWEELDVVQLRRWRSATLHVAAGNVTDELERSDAACPDDDGVLQIGWIRYFDAVDGTVLGDKANPLPYCVVC
jgi:hypothetical protein